jgi:hypothetical protein
MLAESDSPGLPSRPDLKRSAGQFPRPRVEELLQKTTVAEAAEGRVARDQDQVVVVVVAAAARALAMTRDRTQMPDRRQLGHSGQGWVIRHGLAPGLAPVMEEEEERQSAAEMAAREEEEEEDGGRPRAIFSQACCGASPDVAVPEAEAYPADSRLVANRSGFRPPPCPTRLAARDPARAPPRGRAGPNCAVVGPRVRAGAAAAAVGVVPARGRHSLLRSYYCAF